MLLYQRFGDQRLHHPNQNQDHHPHSQSYNQTEEYSHDHGSGRYHNKEQGKIYDPTDIYAKQSYYHQKKSIHLFTINKSKQEKLFSSFNASLSETDCIEALVNHKETVFLHKLNFGSKQVNMFHHLTAAGGTVYKSDKKEFGFIQGVGGSTLTYMTPDLSVLRQVKSDSAVAVPTTTLLFGVSDKDQIDALALSDRITFHPQNFIPIPPFMVPALHNSIINLNGDVYPVLLSALRAIKDFDSIHSSDNEYADKARTKSKDIIFWLYLVSQNHDSVEAVPTMGCITIQ